MTNWVCPYCRHAQVVQSSNRSDSSIGIKIENLDTGRVGFRVTGIGCANKDCRKLTLAVALQGAKFGDFDRFEALTKTVINRWQLLPESSAQPQPPYIPVALVEDYSEACRIRDLSPKASATLARRCLQGMIRDFCGIAKGTLNAEIEALRASVDAGKAPPGVTIETVEAIDQVRAIGNIGAHMEKDINLIIPVDAGEAQLLIDLIEMLFDEWYKARHTRQQRLSRIAAMSAEKKKAIENGKAALAALPAPDAAAEDAA